MQMCDKKLRGLNALQTALPPNRRRLFLRLRSEPLFHSSHIAPLSHSLHGRYTHFFIQEVLLQYFTTFTLHAPRHLPTA